MREGTQFTQSTNCILVTGCSSPASFGHTPIGDCFSDVCPVQGSLENEALLLPS